MHISNQQSSGVGDRAPISVVIPCFRCADKISRALHSVLNQSLLPAEIILVDDGSGDDTVDVLRHFGALYPELVRVLALDVNSGPANARNHGWASATQDYIAFLDADDSWHPRKLEVQYGFMVTHPTVSLSGHTYAVHSATDVSISGYDIVEVSKRSILFKNWFSTPTVMLRRSISQRFLENARFSEDWLLWMTIAHAGMRCVSLRVPLATLYKAPYGASGLSANLCAMQAGELQNLRYMRRAGAIGWLLQYVASFYSLAKFLRRFFTVQAKLLLGTLQRNI